MSTIFTRDKLKEPIKFRWERVSAEEWAEGTHILVWELTMAEQTQVETFVAKYVRSKTNRRGESTVVSSDTAQLNARIAVLCCRDENNRPIFTDDDIPSLIGCPQIVMSRILDAYKRLNQISDEDIEELEKNSEETPISNCGITLPSESGER